MGMKITVTCLQFTDGIRAIFTNKDRKNHWFIPAGTIAGSNETFPVGTKYIYRTMKTTYNQWKNRWAT